MKKVKGDRSGRVRRRRVLFQEKGLPDESIKKEIVKVKWEYSFDNVLATSVYKTAIG